MVMGMGVNDSGHNNHALCIQKLISFLKNRFLNAWLYGLDQTVLNKDISSYGRPVIGHKTVLDQNPFHSTPFSAKKLSYRNSPQGTQGQSQDRGQNVREDHAHAPGPLP